MQCSLIPVIGIKELPFTKGPIWDWHMIDADVIFILEDLLNALAEPNVNKGIADHSHIAAHRRCPKQMDMVHIELAFWPLDHQPSLVVWNHQTSMVELGNVKTTCLSTWQG